MVAVVVVDVGCLYLLLWYAWNMYREWKRVEDETDSDRLAARKSEATTVAARPSREPGPAFHGLGNKRRRNGEIEDAKRGISRASQRVFFLSLRRKTLRRRRRSTLSAFG